VADGPSPTGVRLGELLAVLSLVSDLGMGQPMEHALRQCLIAVRLGHEMGADDEALEATFYAALVAWVGCHVDAYEQSRWFGDDLTMKSDVRKIDASSSFADLKFLVQNVASGQPMLTRARTGIAFVVGGGMRDVDGMLATHCKAADGLAAGFGLNDLVRKSIEQSFERWDGRGAPHRVKGDDILVPSRLINLADIVEMYHRLGGVDAAVAVARERSGTQFDPAVVDLFCDCAPGLFADLDGLATWDAVMANEPGSAGVLTEDQLDAALVAIADFTDVKSPYTAGHSRGVAELAETAATTMGLVVDEITVIRRAGLLHDLGRLGVPNTIWDKQGELTISEVERMRMHPYLTERTLASSSALAPLGVVAATHHERLDGSGYPRGVKHDDIPVAGRVLAAADVYRAKIEPRPHRPALSPVDAAAVLRSEVRSGTLDGDAVEAILTAAGHRARRRRESVGGLTPREVEVLRLLARGLATKQIAQQLEISRKTAANHVEHIYVKIGVNNRALATLYAAKHGLLDAEVAASDQSAGLA
jgi:HD-GYP domain-containing protein (c-di-GMP phosphodiesterase class II)